MSSFRRPVGAQADVKELEYISALHQTTPVCREDGTVSSVDIVRFLRSKMGFFISQKDGIELVRGLGGGILSDEVIQLILELQSQKEDEEGSPAQEEEEEEEKEGNTQKTPSFFSRLFGDSKEPEETAEAPEEVKIGPEKEEDEEQEEYLDMVQLVSILLVPTMARAGKEWRDCSSVEEVSYKDEDVNLNDQVFPDEKEKEDDQQKESLRPKPESIVKDGVAILLNAVPSLQLSQSPKLTPELVQALLEAYGEHERAADRMLIEQMVKQASSLSGNFDEEAFVNAMTNDLSAYNVGCEDQETSPYYDIFGFDNLKDYYALQKLEISKAMQKKESQVVDDDVEAVNGSIIISDVLVSSATATASATVEVTEQMTGAVAEVGEAFTGANISLAKGKMRPMMAAIDMTIDMHSAVTTVVAIWVFYFFSSITYAAILQQADIFKTNCDESFGCQLGSTVFTWLLFAIILIVMGYVVIFPLSLGNSPRLWSPVVIGFSAFMCAVFTWVPYWLIEWAKEKAGTDETDWNENERFVNSKKFSSSQWTLRIVGLFILLSLLLQLVLSLLGSQRIRNSEFLSKWFTTSAIRGSARTKRAATRKINRLLENAHSLHPEEISGTPSGLSKRSSLKPKSKGSEDTMLNFVLRGDMQEDSGGIAWTWRNIKSGALFDTEGVWIMSRLIIIQAAQFIALLVLSFLMFFVTEEAAASSDAARISLITDYDNLPDWVYDIVPTGKQVRGALYPATFISIGVAVVLILLYLPRCGVIPSLKEPGQFTKYRKGVDTVSTNIGNAIYAMIGAAVLFWALFGLVIFLFIWEFSRALMLLVVAWGIGLTITIVLKIVITTIFRGRYFTAFYRSQPRAANFFTLAMEAWYIGLGGGILVGRFTQFILAACFWIGRIDVPFLSPHVNLLGYRFDNVPTNFVKDILVHDAHHHPYLVRLLTMYLLKLKDNEFCSDAGACWRQLFVVAWMPWLMKNRVFTEARISNAMEAAKQKKRESEEEKRTRKPDEFMGEAMENLMDTVVSDAPVEEKPQPGRWKQKKEKKIADHLITGEA
eukprot:scaffold135240_cov62-Attheya_sp.AAC.3